MEHHLNSIDGLMATAEQALEDLLQLESREKFLSLITHDLRTPLTTAKFCAQIIARYPDRPELVTALSRRIVDAIDRGDQLIPDLLDANRLRAGQSLPLRLAHCDLRTVVQEAVDGLHPLHNGRCKVHASEPVEGLYDSSALRRAVENLVSNAIKYGFADTPIEVKVITTADAANIHVHNQGKALTPSEMQSIFKWYGRTQTATESGNAGWGLGLALVKGIAECHGGHVHVDSDASQGTTFTIELPRSAKTHIFS